MNKSNKVTYPDDVNDLDWQNLCTSMQHGALPKIYDNFFKLLHVLIFTKLDSLTTNVIS